MKIYCALGPLLAGPTGAGLLALERNRGGTPMAQGGGGAGRNPVNWRRARVGEVLEGLWSVEDPICGVGRGGADRGWVVRGGALQPQGEAGEGVVRWLWWPARGSGRSVVTTGSSLTLRRARTVVGRSGHRRGGHGRGGG
jgi:hypothetical protein